MARIPWNYIQTKEEILNLEYFKSSAAYWELQKPTDHGMVERFNRTMEQLFSKVMEQHQIDWNKHLLLFLLAYRAAVHEPTRQTDWN